MMAAVTMAVMMALAAVWGLAGLGSGATVCSRPHTPPDGQCSAVRMLLGATDPVHVSSLKQLCQEGRRVLLQSSSSSSSSAAVKGGHQMAVINLHRDGFTDKLSWRSGEAEDVTCSAGWLLDDQVRLSNGYRWYRHGLPLWPLLNQTLAPKRHQIIRKKLDWPNYALATPLYLVPHEIKNYRDPLIALKKLFSGDLASPQDPQKPVDKFARPDLFQAEVTRFITTQVNQINKDPEDYRGWLLPLVKSSLPAMIESFKARQRPRSGRGGRGSSQCPDVLYVFFLQQPCADMAACLLLNEVQLALTTTACRATKLLVGTTDVPN